MSTPQNDITDIEAGMLHRAGLGMYRPQGETTIASANKLVDAGLMRRNAQTGIYFLTEEGVEALYNHGKR